MQLPQLNVYFFFLMLLLVGVVTFFIFQPFLTAILAAAILAALFQKPYQALLSLHIRRGLSAFLVSLLIAVIIILPLFSVLGIALNEANDAYHDFVGENATVEGIADRVLDQLRNIPYAEMIFTEQTLDPKNFLDDLRNVSRSALGLLQTLYQSVAHFVFWIFVMFFTLFYFLIDGKRAVKYLMRISPLRNEHEEILVNKFISMSRATLKGTLMVGIIQGFLGGIAFAIADIPSPVLWGLIMTVLSIIPVLGGGIVWFPAAVISLLTGGIWQGIFLLAVGFGLISTIDNILRPKLVGQDTQMHPLIIFFATLGGIALFGFPGFIIGPIILSLFLALAEIYSIEFKGQLDRYNQ